MPMPDNDVAMASGRLNARKSVSGSGRRTRNGSTTSRVSGVRQRRRGAAVHAANGAQLLGHRVGRRWSIAGRLGHRPPDHAIHCGDGRRAGQRRRLLVAAWHAGPRRSCGRRMPDGRQASRTGWRRRRTDRCARRPPRRSPVRAPCSAACPSAMPVRVSPAARSETGSSSSGRARPKSSSFTPCGGEEHVRRLEVAMDDAARVQRRERGEHAECRSAPPPSTLSGPRAAARTAPRPPGAPSR